MIINHHCCCSRYCDCHLFVKGKEFNIDKAGRLEDGRTQPSDISFLSKNVTMMVIVVAVVMKLVTTARDVH